MDGSDEISGDKWDSSSGPPVIIRQGLEGRSYHPDLFCRWMLSKVWARNRTLWTGEAPTPVPCSRLSWSVEKVLDQKPLDRKSKALCPPIKQRSGAVIVCFPGHIATKISDCGTSNTMFFLFRRISLPKILMGVEGEHSGRFFPGFCAGIILMRTFYLLLPRSHL